MKLLILAGGFGTRLKDILGNTPKAMAVVHGTPFILLQLKHWRRQGVNDFCFLLHHQSDQIVSYILSLKSSLLMGCNVDWVIERSPLDTGGAIANAVAVLGLQGDFLVTNADTWIGKGISELMQHRSPSMVVVSLSDVRRYGLVKFDNKFCVTKFIEKSVEPDRGWINAGMFRLNAEFFLNWDGQPFSLERDLFADLVETRRLKAVPLDTEFIDIGVPEDYYRFCRWIESEYEGRL